MVSSEFLSLTLDSCCRVAVGGFDHHDSLKENLGPKMEELNENLDRFVRQLKVNGQWEQTAIYITSEFARTITPNSNAGSDHGECPSFPKCRCFPTRDSRFIFNLL